MLTSNDGNQWEQERALLQFQVSCEKSSPFTEEERQAIRRQFVKVFSTIRQQSSHAFQSSLAAQTESSSQL
jgi:hypothetical protein